MMIVPETETCMHATCAPTPGEEYNELDWLKVTVDDTKVGGVVSVRTETSDNVNFKVTVVRVVVESADGTKPTVICGTCENTFYGANKVRVEEPHVRFPEP